jgi:hypothetical protein
MNPGFTASRIGHWDLVIPARPNDFAVLLRVWGLQAADHKSIMHSELLSKSQDLVCAIHARRLL